jgi:DNA-binding transcriptional regulator YhcF (GntR family)
MSVATDKTVKKANSKKIVQIIRRRIGDSVYKPGCKLPNTLELCNEFQVSPATIVKCVNQLKTERLLETVSGKGIFVNSEIVPQLVTAESPALSESRKSVTILLVSTSSSKNGYDALDEYNLYSEWLKQQMAEGVQEAGFKNSVSCRVSFIPVEAVTNPAGMGAGYFNEMLGDSEGVVVITPHVAHEHKKQLKELMAPRKVVMVSFVNRPLAHLNMVMEDSFNGTAMLLENLLPYCKKPACLGNDFGRGYTGRRLAWESSLKLFGYNPAEVPFYAVSERGHNIIERAREILSLPAEERPDFIFCFNDFRAIQFKKTMREMGIPEHEIMLAGYDGHPSTADLGISTVRVDGKQKGRLGMYMVQALMDGTLEEPAYHSVCGKVILAEDFIREYRALKNI